MRSKLLLWLTCLAGLPIIAVAIWSVVATPRGPGPRSDATPAPAPLSRGTTAEQYGMLPLAFEPNVGQTDAQVKFLARGGAYTLFLTETEAVFALRSGSIPRSRAAFSRHRATAPTIPPATIRLALAAAQPDAGMTAVDELPGVSNYAVGADPAQWRANVPHYARVRHHGVYPGIDIEYYGNQRQLEYDFVVAPGADAGRIAFAVEGADRLVIGGDGALLMDGGGQQVRLDTPFAYQEIDGARHVVAAAYTLQGSDVRLQVAAYDHARTLVIDPVFVYAANVGGTGDEGALGIAVDSSGNAYIAGATSSTNFPATAGVAQTTFGGGTGLLAGFPIDAMVAKLNAAGTALVYATYLGGAGDDVAFGIAIDAAGSAYVTGLTGGTSPTTNNFPTTVGAFQPTYRGGDTDGFVTKLNASGQLAYSTYLGGGCFDYPVGVALDTAGDAYVVGQTGTNGNACTQDFPVTAGAIQTTTDASGESTIIAKLNTTGSALLYSTYLGGSGSGENYGIAVDAAGRAYVTGGARSDTSVFPTTTGAYQTAPGGSPCVPGPCAADAFVAKINPGTNGTADLIYSTLLGGPGRDVAQAIAIDSSGNAYVTGLAEPNFPTTAGAYQRTFTGLFNREVFVAKLNPTGSALVFSTLFGGGGDDLAYAIALDASQNVYVAGQTNSFNLPTTFDSLSRVLNGSATTSFFCDVSNGGGPNTGCNGFVAKFNPTASVLLYATYLGGSGNDAVSGAAVQGGSVFLAGTTSSTFLAGPSTGAALLSGASDAKVIKLTLPAVGFTDDPVRVGATFARALHITELRTRVNAVRIAHGLAAFAYTDPTLTPTSTIIKAVHITELRTALAQAYTAAGLTPPEYLADPNLAAGNIIRGAHISSLRALVMALESGGGMAVYDASTYMAEACLAVGSVCDSGGLLNGRDTIINGLEPHQPNTIANSCPDGAAGSFHVDPSNDRLRVSTLDGTPFAPGKTVRIEAFVWGTGNTNSLDLYYAANAASPSWTFISTTVAAAAFNGPQTMAATYVLPAGSVQAVRARFRVGGSQTPCTGGTAGMDDHDDLVFAVGP